MADYEHALQLKANVLFDRIGDALRPNKPTVIGISHWLTDVWIDRNGELWVKTLCRYCGCKAPSLQLEIDHVIPVSQGGTDEPDNLRSACRDCNAGKSDRLIIVTDPAVVQ